MSSKRNTSCYISLTSRIIKISFAFSIIILLSFKDSKPIEYRFIDSNEAIDYQENRLSHYYKLDHISLLDFPNGMFVKEVTNVKVKGSHVMIIDSFGDRKIFVFNTDGKFLCEINGFGEGPDQYSILMDATFSHSGDEILILDSNRKTILHFESNTGKLIKTSKLSFPGIRIARMPSGFVFLTNEEIEIVTTDLNFNVKSKFHKRSHSSTFRPRIVFQELKDKTLFLNNYDEVVRVIQPFGFDIYRTIQSQDQNEINRLKATIPFSYPEINRFKEEIAKLYTINTYMEFDKGFIYFERKENLLRKYIVLNNKKELIRLAPRELLNDLTFTQTFPIGTTGNVSDEKKGIGLIRNEFTSLKDIETLIGQFGPNENSSKILSIAKKLDSNKEQFIFCLFSLR